MERKDCFWGLHIDLHPLAEDTVLGADVTEEMVARLLDAAKPDHVAYDCKGHPGVAGYPSRIGEYNRSLVRDSLAVWRKVTREKGVLLGIHYSGLWDNSAIAHHPEYAAVHPDGTPDSEATTPFGNYAAEFMIPQLCEVIEKYQLDSVWLDGECWKAQQDYSSMALDEWEKLTGSRQAPQSASDPNYRRWKEFQRNKFEEYVAAWTSAVKKRFPNINVASNWAYTTMMPVPRKAPVDFLSGDFDPFLSVDRARTECRYLQHTGMPWELQSWSFDLPKTGDESEKLPCHLMQEASIVLMHGGGYVTYFLPTRSGYLDDRIVDTAREVSQFVRARQESCFHSVPVPQVAVLHSREDLMEKSDRIYTWWGNELKELEGILHALLEEHYSVSVMSEYMLEEHMEEYPLIVIPNTKYLTDSFVRRLKDYAAKGGSLFLAGTDCIPYFADCLGAELGQLREENAVIAVDGNKTLIRGEWYDVDPASAQVLEYRYMGTGITARMSYLDVRDSGVSEAMRRTVTRKPAATVVNYGKGKIGAVYGPICLNYFMNHHPFTRALISKMARVLFPDPIVQTDAPPMVDLSVRRDVQGRLCVHLVNLCNMPVQDRRAYVEYIPPLFHIRLEIRYDHCPSGVTAQPENTPLAFSWENGTLNIMVGRLDIHTAVIIED